MKVQEGLRTYGQFRAWSVSLGPNVRGVPMGPPSGRTYRTTTNVHRTLAGPNWTKPQGVRNAHHA